MTDVKDTKRTKTRTQVSKLMGINLSVSRVRGHLDLKNINLDIENALAEFRPIILTEADGKKVDLDKLSDATKALVVRAYTEVYEDRKTKHDSQVARLTKSKAKDAKAKLAELGTFPARTNTAKEQNELVSKLRCRFSQESAAVLASALDYVIQQLMRAAMINARANGKAIIKVAHAVQDTPDNKFSGVEMSALVYNLDVVQEAIKAQNKENKDAKDGDDTEDPKDEEDEDTDDTKKSSFRFYVNQICKSIKDELTEKDDNYKPIRISQEIRNFGSDVVIQMIQRVAPQIKLYTETADIKTVNDRVVKHVFNSFLIDAKCDGKAFNAFVDARLEAYRSGRG
jgi:hypothetical protein